MNNSEKAKAQVEQAILVVVNHHDFYGPAAVSMPWEESSDPAVQTACTNGVQVFYNADFICGLTLAQTVGLVIHELMHPLLGHLDRFRVCDPRLGNIACDYEINNMVEIYNEQAHRKIILPPEGFVDVKKYGTDAAEII